MRITPWQRRGLILLIGLAAVPLVFFRLHRSEKPAQNGPLRDFDHFSLGLTQSHVAVSSVRTRLRPETAPKTGEPRRSIVEMTVEERNQFAEELKSLNGPALSERLFAALRTNGDAGEIDLTWRLLVPKLQNELSESEKDQFYSQIQSLLMGSELIDNQKLELIQMLGSTATPEALQLLLKLTNEDSVPNLRQLVHNMIATVGDVQWGGQFHSELSPILEQAWKTAANTPGYREALAEGIAGVGARSGIELLYQEAKRGGQTVAEFSAQEDNMTWHVFDVFQKIRNPEAVPVLASRLADQPLDNLDLVLSGTALSAMGIPQATTALLQWAQSSSQNAGELLQLWLTEARDPESLAILQKIAASPGAFKNRDNWSAVDRALREWNARRTTTTTTN